MFSKPIRKNIGGKKIDYACELCKGLIRSNKIIIYTTKSSQHESKPEHQIIDQNCLKKILTGLKI